MKIFITELHNCMYIHNISKTPNEFLIKKVDAMCHANSFHNSYW